MPRRAPLLAAALGLPVTLRAHGDSRAASLAEPYPDGRLQNGLAF